MRQVNTQYKRLLRALAIAKILFEQEGYHTQYLEEIEALLRRTYGEKKEPAPAQDSPDADLP